jgi:hypothetical protein
MMTSIPLHDLDKALDKLCDAFHEGKITESELEDTARELTSEWVRIETAIKATQCVGAISSIESNTVNDNTITELIEIKDIIESLLMKTRKAVKKGE